jgi:hypothetical protein
LPPNLVVAHLSEHGSRFDNTGVRQWASPGQGFWCSTIALGETSRRPARATSLAHLMRKSPRFFSPPCVSTAACRRSVPIIQGR